MTTRKRKIAEQLAEQDKEKLPKSTTTKTRKQEIEKDNKDVAKEQTQTIDNELLQTTATNSQATTTSEGEKQDNVDSESVAETSSAKKVGRQTKRTTTGDKSQSVKDNSTVGPIRILFEHCKS